MWLIHQLNLRLPPSIVIVTMILNISHPQNTHVNHPHFHLSIENQFNVNLPSKAYFHIHLEHVFGLPFLFSSAYQNLFLLIIPSRYFDAKEEDPK